MTAAPPAFWAFFLSSRAEIARLTLEHLALVGAALALGILSGVPLGIAVARRPRLSPWILGLTATLQTVPSLALLGLLMLLPFVGGVGPAPAVTALFLYSLMAIVESACLGILQVDHALVDAGRGLGMTDGQLLRMVEIPQALPVMVAGIRLSAVGAIATATVASYIGAGGLGDLIFRGIGRANNAMVAWGAVPAILMSLAVHAGLLRLERRLAARARPR